MQVKRFVASQGFLEVVGETLERNEAANSLMLGVVGRLARHPERVDTPPFLAAVMQVGRPVVAGVITPPHRLILFAEEPLSGKGLEALAAALAGDGESAPGVIGPAEAARRFTEIWARWTGVTAALEMRQRVYKLQEVVQPPPTPGRLRRAAEEEIDLLSGWLVDFNREALQGERLSQPRALTETRVRDGNLYVWEDRGPVSMALKARPTRSGITVTGVYTPPAFRRRGYATACVAALSQRLLDAGYRFCALFTDLANSTSNSIYMKIGYRPVADFAAYDFSKGEDASGGQAAATIRSREPV
jgi:predicted GNAT family acetyltransferase